MNPVRLIKFFFSFSTFIFLAGFSFDASAQEVWYRGSGTISLRACDSGAPSSIYYCYPSGRVPASTEYFSSLEALCAVLPSYAINPSTGETAATASCTSSLYTLTPSTEYRLRLQINNTVANVDYDDDCKATPDSPYCEVHCSATPTPSDCPAPPLEPDDPYCLEDPMNPLCSPEEPTPAECALGVGSQACCASYAYDSCKPDSVAWWQAGSDLSGNITSCSYSCQYQGEPSDPIDPDPYDPPTPEDPNLNPSNPVSPSNPSSPSDPSDPSDPISVDLSGVNERLEILSNLNADGFNELNQNIDELDANNQIGLGNLRGSIDSGFSDLARRLDPSGSPLLDSNAFNGLGGITEGEQDQLMGLLGVTGNESYGDLEHSIDLYDYSDEYTFSLPDATCPAPLVMDLSFGSFELRYEPLCEIFEFLGSLVYLTALFLVPIIVFRGSQ